MRVLLTGAKGQLGQCFKDRLPAGWELIASDTDTLDITNAAAVMAAVTEAKPDAIVNAAAYTAVDKAETEPAVAFAVNAQGPLHLAVAAAAVGARFIHVSTDYVFDGTNTQPYVETDSPNPKNVYGQSKLAGELLALANNPESVVIRTSWVFSEYGNNFVKTMLRLGKERDTLGIVADQIGCPTYAGDLAQAIVDILLKKLNARGIYHYSNAMSVNWFEFAQKIFEYAKNIDQSYTKLVLNPIASSQYPTPAYRPAYSIMDTRKISAVLKEDIPSWLKPVEKVVALSLQ